jgi:hypothetical protein
METIINTSTIIQVKPTTDASNGVKFGMSGGMSAAIETGGDQAFFIRTFYPSNANYDAGSSGADDSFLFGGFPGFADSGTGGTAEADWNGVDLSIVTMRAIVIEVKPIQAYLGTAATGVLTSDTTNVADATPVTVGSVVYRFKNTMALAYDVKIGATAAISLANLAAALEDSGTPGTEYYAGTAIHPDVTVTGVTATTLAIAAARTGDAGNAIATTETSTHLSWAAATLTGGEDITSPSVARTLEGQVVITLAGDFMPGSGSNLVYTVDTPSLFTLAVPEGWTPGVSASMTVRFISTLGGPLIGQDVNAVVTVALIGTSY